MGRFLRHGTLFAQDDSFCSIWTLFAQGVIFLPQNHQYSLGITWVWRTRPPRPAKVKNVPEIQIFTKIPKISSKLGFPPNPRYWPKVAPATLQLCSETRHVRNALFVKFLKIICENPVEQKLFLHFFLRAEIFHKITRFRVLRQTM